MFYIISCFFYKQIQEYFREGPELFYKKTMRVRVIWISFVAGPIHKLFKSGVHFAVRCILWFLRPIFFPNGSLKS